MRRLYTEEEKKLQKIYEPYIDDKTNQLRNDAPEEAKEALKKCIEIDDEIRYAECFGLPCKYDY